MDQFARALLEIIEEDGYIVGNGGSITFSPNNLDDRALFAQYVYEALKRVGSAPILAALATNITRTFAQAQPPEGESSFANTQNITYIDGGEFEPEGE